MNRLTRAALVCVFATGLVRQADAGEKEAKAVIGKEFKADLEGEEKVDGKPASAVRVTGPDGKDFKILFDKESGLPVRVSGRVADWEGEEYDQETTLEEYKEFEGIKVATRTRTKKNGARYVETNDI